MTTMKELKILVSQIEMTTHDLYQMGNFFENYISGIKKRMEADALGQIVDISPATISIITEAINFGTLTTMGVQYVPNFDALPNEIKEGIKNGKYIIGESKQVNGDMRAVLIDKETKLRVKDITLKEVKTTPDTMELSRNILTQLQMKQINEKLDLLCDMQKFQLKRDRDRDLVEPFFKARDYIRDAQVTVTEADRERYLNNAMDVLGNVIQAGYQDMRTSAKELAKLLQKPLFQKIDRIREFMNYIAEDIYIVNKCIGIKLQIFDYQDKAAEAKATLQEYITNMHEFAEDPIGPNGESAIGLLQDNYPYKNNNKDLWYSFTINIASLKSSLECLESPKQTFLICAEN